MIDPNLLTENFEYTKQQLARRGFDLTPAVAAMAAEHRTAVQTVDDLREKKNRISSEVGALLREDRRYDAYAARETAQSIGMELRDKEDDLTRVAGQYGADQLKIPNLPAEHTPNGATEADNVVTSVYGKQPKFDFQPQDHLTLAERLGIIDMPRGARLAQPRFSVLLGKGAQLSRGLIAFMLENAKQRGYTEVNVPYLVNSKTMQGTGQLPKFTDDLFETTDGLFLIPTAEVPITNLHAGETIPVTQLPKLYAGYTESFRREAGSAGRDTRGIMRVHQFPKVELVQITHPDKSWAALDRITDDAASVLQDLNLHHRRVALCAGDLGFAAAWTTDLEAYLPGEGKFREVSSVSNMTDFQARRLGIRTDEKVRGGKKRLAHTLNGSALAVGRTMIAILEQGQRADGSVVIPEALRKYVDFSEINPK